MSAEFASGFLSALRAAAGLYARHDSDIARRAVAVLKETCVQAAAPLPANSNHRACVPISALLEGAQDSLSPALLACCHDLAWRDPGYGNLPSAISRHMAVTELLGPDGMLSHDHLRIGLLYQGPAHFYPEHSHAAEELYVILRGEADWRRADSAPTRLSAGAFIHHAPWEPHATRTTDQPLLALWIWGGDIGAGTYSLER